MRNTSNKYLNMLNLTLINTQYYILLVAVH